MTHKALSGPASHYYFSQRLRLHYNDWGNEDAPLLLLIHGGLDHSRSWDWVAQELKDDWHVVCPDLRGHGDSEWSKSGNYSVEACVYDVAQLVHQLGQNPATIIAHSFGGNVALRYAGVFPEKVRRLISIEGTGVPVAPFSSKSLEPPAKRLRNWVDEMRSLSSRHPRRYEGLAEAETRMKERNGSLSDEQAHHLTVHGMIRNEDGSYSWKFDNYNRSRSPIFCSTEEVYELWGNIDCPVLHLWGETSFADNPREAGILDHFKDASQIDFAAAGHWLQHDQFEKFVQVVRDFI